MDDCAQAYIDIAKNSSLTGQRIQVGMYLIGKIERDKADFWIDSGLGQND